MRSFASRNPSNLPVAGCHLTYGSGNPKVSYFSASSTATATLTVIPTIGEQCAALRVEIQATCRWQVATLPMGAEIPKFLIDFENRLIYLSRQVMVLERDAELFPYEKDVVSQYPALAGIRYVARDPKYDSKRVVPIPEELYALLLEKKEEQELNALLYGSDYKHYWYTRQYAPQFENRTYESFCRRNGRNGGYDPKRIEQGIINSCGIGYPLHFVNVRENGELLRPDCVTDLLAVVHGDNGRKVISPTFNLHSLRNTFVSKAREVGMREHLIAAIVGHKNEETTEGYMRVSSGEFFFATNHIRNNNHVAENGNYGADNFDFQEYIKTLDKKSLKAIFDQVSNALYGV